MSETGEIVQQTQDAWEGHSVTLSERGTVVVDDVYEFPLDQGAAMTMCWRPTAEGQPSILTGRLGGQLDFEWTPGDSTRYFVLHTQGEGGTFSRLIPQWHSVKRGMDGIAPGDEIVIIHRGLKTLQSGRTWHDIVIGRPIEQAS